jgi:hypothetical protein
MEMFLLSNTKPKHKTSRKRIKKQKPIEIIRSIIKTNCANYISGRCLFDKDCNLLKEKFEECGYFNKNILPRLTEEEKVVIEDYKNTNRLVDEIKQI